MLHCGKCQQPNAEDNSTDSPASVGKAKAPSDTNSTHSAYVFCIDCNEHLCERCDYIVHDQGQASGSDQGDGGGGSTSKPDLPKSPEEEKHYRSEQMLDRNEPQDEEQAFPMMQHSSTGEQQSCHEDPSQWSSRRAVGKGTSATSVGGQKHARKSVCDECAGKQSEARCPTCEQNLCAACWGRIHNKGTRRKHRQRSLKEPPVLPPNCWKRNINISQYNSTLDQESVELRSNSNAGDQDESSNGGDDDRNQGQLLPGLQVRLSGDRQKSAKRADPLQQYKNENERAPSLLAAGIQSQEVIENSQNQYSQLQQNSTPYSHNLGHNQANPSNYPSQSIHPSLQFNLGQGYAPAQAMQPHMNHAYPYPSGMQGNTFQAPQPLYPPHFHQQQYPATAYTQPMGHTQQKGSPPNETQVAFSQAHVFDRPQQYAQYMAAQGVHRPQSFLQQTVQKVQTQHSVSDDDFQSQGIHEEAVHQKPGQSMQIHDHPKHAAFRQSNVGLASEHASNFKYEDQQTADQTLRSTASRGPDAASFEQVGQNNLNQGRFKALHQQKSPPAQIQTGPRQNDSNGSKGPSLKVSSSSTWTNPNENALYYNPVPRPPRDSQTTSAAESNKYRVKQPASDQTVPSTVQTSSKYVNYRHQEYSAEDKKGPHLRSNDTQGKVSMKHCSDNSSLGANDSDYSSDNVQHPGVQSGKHAQNHGAGSKNNSFDAYGGYSLKQTGMGKHRTPNIVRDKSANSAHSLQNAMPNSANTDRKPSNSRNEYGQSGDDSGYGSFNTEKQPKRGIIRMASSEAGSSQRAGPNSAAYGNPKSSSGNATSNQSKSKSGPKFPRGQLILNNEIPRSEPVPVKQPTIKIALSNQRYQRRDRSEETKQLDDSEEMERIQLLLFGLAEHGELLVLKENFIARMKEGLIYSDERCQSVIEKAEAYGVVHQTVRNFANSQKIELVSLKIEVLSHQCLQWVITSLRRDEMTPTEAAIKNRTKEAFALKIYDEQWETIMSSIRAQQPAAGISTQDLRADAMQHQQQQSFHSQQPDKGASGHTNRKASGASEDSETSLTAPLQQPFADTGSGKVIEAGHALQARTSQSFLEALDLGRADRESSSSPSPPAFTPPRFKIVGLPSNEEDPQNPAVAPAVKAIYMEGEEVWLGVDIDDESTVDVALFRVMKDFLKEYFCVNDHASSDGIELQSSADGGRKGQLTPNRRSSSGANTSSDATNANALNNEAYGIGADVRTIPGGRYGCTQYLKICGPPEIRACSVGKTTQMVQLAIKQDVLRHHKTLIVWSTQVDKHKTDQDQIEDQQKINLRQSKLSHVRQALIEILAESKNGMSLAQLPQYLKKKLPFTLDLNELGFPKLKDLLKSMDDEIKIELKDVNHPFAYLLRTKGYEKCRDNRSESTFQIKKGSLFKQKAHHLSQDVNVDRHLKSPIFGYTAEEMQQIISAFWGLLRKHPMGILSTEMNMQISEQVGFQFSHTHLNCKSEYEFVKKYIMPRDASIEFIYDQQRRRQDSTNSQEVVRQLFWVRSRTIVQEYILSTEQLHKLNIPNSKSKGSKNQSFSSSQSQQIFQEPQIQSVPCQTEVSNDLSQSMASGGPQPRALQTQPQHHDTGDSLAMRQNYIPTCETLYGSFSQFSSWSEFSHIKHQSNMTIDSSNCNTGKQLLSHLNRDQATPTAYPSGSQPVTYQQQPFSHSVFGQNPSWNAYPQQRPEQAAQAQMNQNAVNAPSYNPASGFEPRQEAHQHHQSQGAPVLDEVRVDLRVGNGQSRNGPPQRQQVQSQVIQQDRYELFGSFGRRPSQEEQDGAESVRRQLQDLIGNQDEGMPTGAVNSLFNSPEQERQNLQTMHGVQGGYPSLRGDGQGHFGTQDNVGGNQYSDLMLNSYHQPSDDSSFANQSIFNEHQPLFAKLPGAKLGSVKSQDFDAGLLEGQSSQRSLYQPNSMSNQRDYPQDFSLFTGGRIMNQDRDTGERLRGGLEKSILSMQEKDSHKLSRGYEAPVSEGHFQQRPQTFFQGSARNLPHTQIRITEENSGGDCSTNKSPDAREEAEPQIVQETGQEPERRPQAEDEEAKLI